MRCSIQVNGDVLIIERVHLSKVYLALNIVQRLRPLREALELVNEVGVCRIYPLDHSPWISKEVPLEADDSRVEGDYISLAKKLVERY